MSHLNVNGADKPLDHIYVNTGSEIKEAWEARVRTILHGLSEPLCGISTYKDLLVLSTGDLTRYVKKLVLTGGDDENWSVVTISANNCIFRLDLSEYPLSGVAPISTHYTGSTADLWVNVADGEVTTSIRNLNAVAIHHIGLSGVTDWKAYLAAQYAAGTPVTIWYVLATPETEQIAVPAHLTGTVEGYLTQTEPPTPTNPIHPTANGAEEQGGTYSIDTGEYALAWGRADTFTGTNSISLRGYGLPVKSWSISGNGQQTGTPTPDNPIMPDFVGVRTANLCPEKTYKDGYYINESGVEIAGDTFCIYSVPAEVGADFSLSTNSYYSGTIVRVHGYTNGTWQMQIKSASIQSLPLTFAVPQGVDEVRISILKAAKGDIMLNSGATALPYEPFGYKIPITSAGQTQNVYLGQVQTVRKIRKYEFTGNEQWSINTDTRVLYTFAMSDFLKASGITCICSHYPSQENADGVGSVREKHVCFRTSTSYNQFYLKDADFDSTDALKAFLQQQYAAGTPVTVWYVLADQETGIVNEPLAKIGDYADELSSENTNTTLNTNDGATTITVDTTLSPSEFVINVHAKPIAGT